MDSKVWSPILVVTIITFKYVICDRCGSWSGRTLYNAVIPDEAMYTCYQQQLTNECKFEVNKTDLKVCAANKEDGTMDFEFNYEPNCIYMLNAFIWPEINNEESCKMQEMSNDVSDHSVYTYSGISELDNEDSQNICTKRGQITAKYLYTGCYHFQFKKNQIVIASTRRYLTIRHKLLTYSDFESESAFYVQHRDEDSTTILEIKHPFLKDNPNLKLIIDCTDCTTPSHAVYRITPTLSNISSTMEYNLYCYKEESANITMDCKTNGVSSIVCTATGLNNGLYDIKYTFKNLIRCPLCTNCGIWDNCSKRILTQLNDHLTLPVLPDDSDNIFPVIYSVLLGLAFVGLILLVTFLIYRHKSAKQPLNIPILLYTYTEEETLIGKGKVLLLYPRDAEVVMQTMKTLRVALQAEGFEVYDIYDQDQQKSIDEIKEKWIIDKLSDKYMKTLIIQTYCGQILSNSSHSAWKLYKKPTCYDDFFPYALSLIRARVDSKSYTKLFIATMGFDKMNYAEFNFLNPCARYGLPQNFNELIRDLHHQQQCPLNMLQSKNELREFNFMCNNMKNFIEDPSYLTDILHVSVFKIGDKIRINEPF